LAREAVTVAYDPLRTRARFLGAVPQSQREAWVRAAEAALDEVHRRVQAWQTDYGEDDPFLALISRNGELDVQSRRLWLRRMAEAVGIDLSVGVEGNAGTGKSAARRSRGLAGRGG